MQNFKRAICLAPLLLVMIFGNFSCQDHSIIETPIQIQTLPLIKDYGNVTFRVDIKDAGTIPVVEYGTAYTLVIGNATQGVPTINNSRVRFDPPATNGEKSKMLDLLTDEFIFYRAYAVLSDGQVIYGQILSKDGRESD